MILVAAVHYFVFFNNSSKTHPESKTRVSVAEFSKLLVLNITKIEKDYLLYTPEKEFLTINKSLGNSEYILRLSDDTNFFDEMGRNVRIKHLSVGDRLFVLGSEDIVLASPPRNWSFTE